MKKVFVIILAVSFLVSLGGSAVAQEKKETGKKPKVTKERVTTVKATVEAIDMQNRVISLRGPRGNVFDIKVGEEVKNLPQVKVGDEVVAKYRESVVVKVMPPGSAGGVTASESVVTAKPGERPAAAVTEQVTITATVEAIDPNKTFVTLKGPQGKTIDARVRNPRNLENVKVGDRVDITYTAALAISVQKAKKK